MYREIKVPMIRLPSEKKICKARFQINQLKVKKRYKIKRCIPVVEMILLLRINKKSSHSRLLIASCVFLCIKFASSKIVIDRGEKL